MAAVVASLAAFVAGAGLPAFPLTRGPNQDRNLSSEEDLSSGVAWCSAHRQAKLCTSSAPEAQLRKSAAPSLAKAAKGGREGSAAEAAEGAALQDANAEAAEGLAVKLKEHPGVLLKAPRKRRPQSGLHRVSFDLGKSTVHEVTPYAEVYGVHPRDFNFARGRPGPTACFADTRTCSGNGADDMSDSDDEDEEGWREKSMRLLRVESVPWPVWSVALVLSFLVHAFGPEAFVELASGALSAQKAY